MDVAKLKVECDIPDAPPPVGFTSPFNTIQEWLYNVCDNNSPAKPISDYHFSLIEGPSDNLLNLLGFNTYDIAPNAIAHRIDFKPAAHAFFALPKEEFGNLSKQEVRERILNQLLEFTRSDKFKNSFFAKGNSIRTSFAGEIWPG